MGGERGRVLGKRGISPTPTRSGVIKNPCTVGLVPVVVVEEI